MRGFPGPFRPRVIPVPGHEFLHWLIPLIFLVVLGAILIWAVLRVTRQSGPSGAQPAWGGVPTVAAAPTVAEVPGDPAVELVRSRYARGEIGRDEFVQVLADLGAPPVAPPSPARPTEGVPPEPPTG